MPKSVSRKAGMGQELSFRDARKGDEASVQALVASVLNEYRLRRLVPRAGGDFEIRKMYFVPQVRGRGHGRRLLEDLIEGARQRGCERVVLETASVLKEAIALYRSFGFKPFAREHLACRCDQAMALEL